MDYVIKPKSTKEDKEVRALTIEEQQNLSNYLLNCTINEEKYKNVFLIRMYLGLRIGETLALNINDIDIEKQIINVNKTLTLGKNNEYQVMLKGKSWKGRLISAIDFSLSNTNSKEEFILYMNQFGYDVNWQNTRKYITYTTPEGMKCRDNKLHEEKYLKEKMEDFYGIKRNESITHSSANEYENGRTSQKANIFRRTNSEIRKARRINGFNNGKYKKIYKGIKCKNVQNRNNGNIRESAVDFL